MTAWRLIRVEQRRREEVSDEESGAKNILEIITYPIHMLNQFIKKIKRKKMSGEGDVCEESLGMMCCRACMERVYIGDDESCSYVCGYPCYIYMYVCRQK